MYIVVNKFNDKFHNRHVTFTSISIIDRTEWFRITSTLPFTWGFSSFFANVSVVGFNVHGSNIFVNRSCWTRVEALYRTW